MYRLSMNKNYKDIGTIPASLKDLWKVGMTRNSMKGIKKIFAIFLVFFTVQPPVFAGLVPDDPKTEEALKANVVDFRDWLMKQLSQFPKSNTAHLTLASRNYGFNPRKKRDFTASQYNQAAKSNWVKCQVMQGLSVLSQQLANTAGTAFAPQSANQLQQSAIQLKQSDDPQFQQVGALYTQEAQALQAGNIQGADQAANPSRRRSPALCRARIPAHPKRKRVGASLQPGRRDGHRQFGRNPGNYGGRPNITGPWDTKFKFPFGDGASPWDIRLGPDKIPDAAFTNAGTNTDPGWGKRRPSAIGRRHREATAITRVGQRGRGTASTIT